MKKITFYLVITLYTCLHWTCQREYFTQSGMAEDHFFLKSGNQQMPVTVAGNIDSRKFIFIIHGGPGGNGLVYRDSFVKATVEQQYAVVYWDQRFAGNTQGNGGNSDITAFKDDIKKLLILLSAKYGSDIKIYMLAHSWGGFLAPYFLSDGDNQKLVKGWIQTNGAHNYRLNDSLTREMLIRVGNAEIAKGNNTPDWQSMVDWCKANGFEGNENTSTLNGYAFKAEELLEDVYHPQMYPTLEESLQNAIMSQWTNDKVSTMLQIDQPAYSTPNSDQLYKIKIPTLLLWGKYDFVCPPELAQDIQSHIGSADVNKIIYNHSGHSPMVNEYDVYWKDVMKWVGGH